VKVLRCPIDESSKKEYCLEFWYLHLFNILTDFLNNLNESDHQYNLNHRFNNHSLLFVSKLSTIEGVGKDKSHWKHCDNIK